MSIISIASRSVPSSASRAAMSASSAQRARTSFDEFGELRAHAAGLQCAAALEFEQILRDFPALVLVADAVGFRHAHVVEEHFVEFVVAAVAVDRAHGDARQIHVEQTTKEMPSCRLPSVEVRTSANMRFDLCANVVQIFWPLMM